MQNILNSFTHKEKSILKLLAMLPVGKYDLPFLIDIFFIGKNDKITLIKKYSLTGVIYGKQKSEEKQFKKLLKRFVKKGFLNYEATEYEIIADKKEMLIKNLQPNINDCGILIDALKLGIKAYDTKTSIEFNRYTQIAEHLIDNIDGMNENLRILNFILASRYRERGNFKKALKFSLNEINICELKDSENLSSLANSYYNVSITYKRMGMREDSLKYMLKSVELREKILEPNHPWLATSFSIVASAYRDLGHYRKALGFSLKELNIREKIETNDFTGLAHTYKSLAISYFHTKEFDKANVYIEKAVKLFSESYPDSHLHVQTSKQIQNDISKVYNRWQDFIGLHLN